MCVYIYIIFKTLGGHPPSLIPKVVPSLVTRLLAKFMILSSSFLRALHGFATSNIYIYIYREMLMDALRAIVNNLFKEIFMEKGKKKKNN